MPHTVEQMEEFLTTLTNGAESLNQRTLDQALANLHPTLQQTFWRMVKSAAFAYDDLPAAYFDRRNEASHEWTGRVTGRIDKRPNLVGLPTI